MPLKLDAEKSGQPVAMRYGVTGFPTILFLNSKGQIVSKIGGYLPPSGFAMQMEEAILRGKLPQLEQKYRAHSNDFETLAKLVRIYAGQGRGEEMLDGLRKLDSSKVSAGSMAAVYNAAGDYFQTRQKVDPAVSYYVKAATSATAAHNDDLKAYALINAAGTYSDANQPKKAVPYLRQLLKMGAAKQPYVDAAKQILSEAGG